MKHPHKWSYDKLYAKVNTTYKRTNDVREIVKETGIDGRAVRNTHSEDSGLFVSITDS
jgi:hypothetical protein